MRWNGRRLRSIHGVRLMFVLAPIWGVFSSSPLRGATILAQVTGLGSNQFEYQFTLQGFDLLKNQEIDIRFNPAAFASLFNGDAGSGFQLILLQPNNPVGAFGDYSIMATVDHPSLSGPFTVDVTALQATPPSNLPYIVHQFDSSGQRILSAIGSGEVAPSATAPEPGGFWLAGATLLCGALRVTRSRSKRLSMLFR
jgi:hypothetical protein